MITSIGKGSICLKEQLDPPRNEERAYHEENQAPEPCWYFHFRLILGGKVLPEDRCHDSSNSDDYENDTHAFASSRFSIPFPLRGPWLTEALRTPQHRMSLSI